MAEGDAGLWLLCLAGQTLCALPLEAVVETMRPLPIRPLPGAPDYVSGLAIVRGTPLPVVEMQRLFGSEPGPVERFVVVRVGTRSAALAFSSVAGVRRLSPEVLSRLPPLVDRSSPAITSLGMQDGELMLMLDAGHVVPDDVFAALDSKAMAS